MAAISSVGLDVHKDEVSVAISSRTDSRSPHDSDQTANSVPLGSMKWKRRPPGKEKGGFVIVPPASSTAFSDESKSWE